MEASKMMQDDAPTVRKSGMQFNSVHPPFPHLSHRYRQAGQGRGQLQQSDGIQTAGPRVHDDLRYIRTANYVRIHHTSSGIIRILAIVRSFNEAGSR